MCIALKTIGNISTLICVTLALLLKLNTCLNHIKEIISCRFLSGIIISDYHILSLYGKYFRLYKVLALEISYFVFLDQH